MRNNSCCYSYFNCSQIDPTIDHLLDKSFSEKKIHKISENSS